MYADDVTSQAVARASQALGYDLTYHTRGEIDAAIAHLDTLWDPDRKSLRRALTPEETRFIQNERTLCMLDFRGYWLDRYAWIVNYKKQPQRFSANFAQNIVMDLWADRERNGLAIWMQQLKARRLGVSTISELAVQHRFQFHPHSNCVVASADPTKSLEMAGMIKFSLDRQPWWLLPQGKPKIQSAIPVEYPDIQTKLTIQAGNQFTGVARGSTPNVIHLSELMEWQDAEDLIDGALMRAIIDTPNVFGILESTGGGLGTWWHRTWEQSKKDYARGRSRMIPLFLPWYVGVDLYPSAADLRARPVPEDWQPSDRTIQHAEAARAYVTKNPLLLEYLAKGDTHWRLTREQMWFREIEYETAKDKKQLHIFHMELCANDFEAFQSSNISVIDAEILIGYQERTRDPIAVYTVTGPEIASSLTVPRRYWRTDQPPVVIRTRDLLPNLDLTYQLIPVDFEGYAAFDEAMKVLVWEAPSPLHVYGLGLDCSEGLRQDNTVIEVLREATPLRSPGQVAEFAYDQVTAMQVWPILLALACWYSPQTVMSQTRKQARVAIESFTNGSAAQHELQKRGWVNFHPWQYNDKRHPQPEGEVQRFGVYTNVWFRSVMQDMLLTCLNEEAIDLPSPYLVQELITLEKEPGTTKVKAAHGAHDDRFMSLGFPLFSLHQNKPPSAQFKRTKVVLGPEVTGEAIAHPVWQAPDHSRSDLGIVAPVSHRVLAGRRGSAPRLVSLADALPQRITRRR